MTLSERNKHLRELANEIAARTAKIIESPFAAPKCHRITQRRGHGDRDGFSIPGWAAANTDYFVYYVIHETCHATGRSHDSKFHADEQKALRVFGMKPTYERGGAGPYIEELNSIDSNALLYKL